ncbi:ABC transporter permease [Micromonospora sp. ATA51]|uniref:ABC transporter permease n=1 Tax=Micromonospora sp. ATA51 TaxID=2806098 RepID=UPI001EE4B000|nr:ABC transporter permease [Micromonospora sp. ATA51]
MVTSSAVSLAGQPAGATGTETEPADQAPVGPPRRRRGGRRPLIHSLQVALAAAVLGGWQLFTSLGLVDPFFFPKPTDIAARIWEWISTGYILDDLYVTLEEALLAFVIGSALGLIVGFVLARMSLVAGVLDPYLKMFNALPRVVLAPIFLLWFGLGIWSKVAFGVTLVFFIVFFNTYQGVRDVDRVLVDNARMLGASEQELIRHVLLPSALTWIFSSLHISAGFAITGAVVGEYLGAAKGVGYVIAQSEGVFDTTGVFAGMIILMLVVLVIDLLVNRLEARLLRWQHSARTA